MNLKDWTQSMWDKVKARSPFGQEDMASNMANGGFSGYKPNTTRHRAMHETVQQPPVSETAQMDPMMTGMNWAPPQQPEQPMGFGGFTGMVPPQATAYQQNTYQQMGYQPAGYQPPVNGWQQMDPMGAGGYAAPQTPTGFGNTVPFPPVQSAPQQPQYQQPAQQDNISYMPGNFVGEDGTAYSHCERIAMIANVSMCYRIIEFMRNNESVIVSTEQITDEDENQRCLDLLYGAAFAMKCSFTRISAKSIYLIAPGTVMVIPYKAVRQISDQDMANRWPEQERETRRERFAQSESRYGGRSQGFERQTEGYRYGRGSYAPQESYNPYGYQAVGYGR